jgi:oligoendopeptidase F
VKGLWRYCAVAFAILWITAAAVPPASMGVKDWDLDAQYPSQAAWDATQASVDEALTRVDSWRGRRITSAGELADLLDVVALARGRAGSMARFALLQSSLDARSDSARARFTAATGLEASVDASTSWVEAKVREVGREQIAKWMLSEDRLRVHAWRISEIFRLSGHGDPPGAESVFAGLERARAGTLDIYRALLTADIGWPTVQTPEGSRTVDFLSYAQLRRNADHDTRVRVNSAYLGRLARLAQPLNTLLLHHFEIDATLARARGYTNGIDAFFWHDDGIPSGSYRRIFQVGRLNHAVAARYLRLVARLSGAATPTLDDLYAPPPNSAESYALRDVTAGVVDSWAAAGTRYQARLRARLSQPWMDLAPRAGKDTSAGGVYWAVGGGHPYVLLSLEPDLPSAESFSAACALLMFYADLPADKRPERREEDFPVYSNAVWFAGELLYNDYLFARAKTRSERIALVASQLYRLWSAYFQNAIVTEFEDEIGQSVASARSVPSSEVSERYLALLKAYYDDPQIHVDPEFAYQWMSYPFLFDSRHILAEWAMAMAAGAELVDKIESRDQQTISMIRAPLAAAGSYTSFDLLRDEHIDVDSDEPYQAVLRRMNSKMDVLERLLTGRVACGLPEDLR